MKLTYKLFILLSASFVFNIAVILCVYNFVLEDNGKLGAKGVGILAAAELITVFLIFLLFMFVLEKILIKPVKKLSNDIKQHESGKEVPLTYNDGEISELRQNFAEFVHQLDEEKAKQNRIIASISHDVKTPLTSVMGYTELLMNPALPEERRKKYLNVIYEKSQQIKDIIVEFDDYLNGEFNMQIQTEIVNLRALCEDITDDLKDQFSLSQPEISLLCTADGYINADGDKLYRVFMNAISNSINHSQKQTGLKIHIVITEENGHFVFAITDNGNGVAKDQLEKIFEPMYTCDKSRSVAGLGLAICKEIINAHGGEIYAESEEGRYFSVVFKLKKVNGEKN